MNDEARPPSRPLEELFLRYWDGALAPEELAGLNQALAADQEARELFQQFCLQALSVSDQFAVERLYLTPAVARAATSPARGRRGWLAPATAAAVLIAAALVAVARWRPAEATAGPAAIAWLDELSGNVWVSGGGAEGAPARPKQPLYSGQSVSLSGGDGSAEVRFRDGTRLVLHSDTAVQVSEDDRKTVRVHRGHLAADVRPQPPGRPMTLVTPEAEVRVLGTLLSISGTKRATEVAVVKGEVLVTQLSDRQSVALHPGELATAVKGGTKLVLRKGRDLPDAYAADFGQLPPDWEAGEVVRDGLPPGSAAGVRAAPWHSDEFGTQYQVRSQNAWTAGLVELHEDSWLHVRFRVDRPGFFHVLFVARGADPAGKVVVLEAPLFFQDRRPGEWSEASVPLGRSKRVGRPPPGLRLPLVAYRVIVSSNADDRGLVIDRLWVTRSPDPRQPPGAVPPAGEAH